MSKCRTLLPYFFSFVIILMLDRIALSQDHAPTAEQCKADVAVWGSTDARTRYNDAETAHINKGIPNTTDIARMPIDHLTSRMGEMYQCMDVVGTAEPYSTVGTFYHDVMMDRYHSFVIRHGLQAQMLREDAVGKR